MSPEMIGIIATAVLLTFMFLGVPIGICMAMVGFVGFLVLKGSQPAFSMSVIAATTTVQNYTLATLPVFLFMGEIADMSGMMRDAFKSANIWFGRLPGGLAMASIVGAAAFSAVSGSSMACAAITSRVALPQLLDHKYDPALATGALAAGGTLGNLIPPGILLIVYAMISEVSLGRLFIACIVPGITLMLMYVVQIYIQCRINPSLGPRAESHTWGEKIVSLKDAAATVIVFGLVMGGIQFGVFTPNEAASVGTVFVFVYAVMRRTVRGQAMGEAFKNTLITTGMTMAIIIGANMFSYFGAISRLPQALATWLLSFHPSVLGVIIFMMVVYFILGIVMNAMPMLLLTIPIFLPILKAYNVNLIWFGVLVIIQMELANLTPPVGLNLFIVAGIAKPRGISMNTVFRGSLPFCFTMLVFNAILIAFPQLALFLVNTMKQ